MIVVTHLLGSGHLSRALTLARAFRAAGHAVQLVSGGVPVPHLEGGVDLVQLAPLRSDGTDFTRLLDGHGAVATPAHMATRRSALLAAEAQFAPDILITELFPFGRRALADEFLALLAAARARRALVLSSIRDILAPPRKPGKADKAHAILAASYDGVLVHSDPDIIPLTLSWPVDAALAAQLHYTGFVAPPPALDHPTREGIGDVLVSAGGGAVGHALFQAAASAAPLSDLRWRLLIGGPEARATIATLPAGPALAEPARRDFRAMLRHAAASVSMCGYNTTLDLLQAGTPAVLVPFDEGGEVEQALRARALTALPGITVLPAADLTPPRLNAAVRRVMAAKRRAPRTEGFDGAARSVALAIRLARERPS